MWMSVSKFKVIVFEYELMMSVSKFYVIVFEKWVNDECK